MSSNPRVSVLMSVYNGDRYVSKALDSILGQTFGDFEFIIIDDGSTDQSRVILENAARIDNRIKLFRQKNTGLVVALNRGLGYATGNYIARMDADDISRPDRLEKQVSFLDGNQAHAIVGSAYEVIDENGEIQASHQPPVNDWDIRWQMLYNNSFAHASVMLRRETLVLNELRYSEACAFAQDYELWSRLLEYAEGANMTERLIMYRVHSGQISFHQKARQRELAIGTSARTIRKLGLELSDRDVQVLFDGYHRVTFLFNHDDCHLLLLLFRILERFSRKPNLPESYVKDKSEGWIRGIMANMSKGESARFFGHRLFWMMMACNPAAVASIMYDKVLEKLKSSR